MSQEAILKFIDKRGMVTLKMIKENIKNGNSGISHQLEQMEKYDEIKSINYHSSWKIYCSKEVFAQLNGIHKIRSNPEGPREVKHNKNFNNRRTDTNFF
jgi:hypothetical protein